MEKYKGNKKTNIVPLKDLNLTSRFLFDEVMEDPQTHQDALSIIFGKELPLLEKNETEKELRVSPLLRSVRMDVFSMDMDKNIYNTEMQEQQKADLAKRSRYYQSLIDTGLLEPGVPNYNLLNNSYIIMIMPFDLFGFKKYVYTFEPRCKEVPGLVLKDGATRIFLNIHGENDEEVPEELREFLHYLEHTTDQVAAVSGSERIKRIHDRVRKVKLNEEVGVKYMQAWEEKYYEREEGREEGRKVKLVEQVCKKLKKKCTVSQIADMLEEKEGTIQAICDIAQAFEPDYDVDEIMEALQKTAGN